MCVSATTELYYIKYTGSVKIIQSNRELCRDHMVYPRGNLYCISWIHDLMIRAYRNAGVETSFTFL